LGHPCKFQRVSRFGSVTARHSSIGRQPNFAALSRGLKCAARGSLQIQDAKKSPKSPSGHHCTTSTGYIFATKARIDNRKKLVKQQYLLHMPYNMMNFGPITAEIVSLVWGTPANFNGFRVLPALLHGI